VFYKDKKYPKYWVEFEPLKTVLKKKNYFVKKYTTNSRNPYHSRFLSSWKKNF